jgi:hypothetical protein
MLHARFGDLVELEVGFLAYPSGGPGKLLQAASRLSPPSRPSVFEAGDASFRLSEPVLIRSGHDADATLLCTNTSDSEWVVETTGRLFASVLDPHTDEIVGGYAGADVLPLITFRVPRNATVPIPLLIGTASSAPRLGFALPPGEWAAEAVLDIEGQPSRRTPPLPFAVC